MLRTCVNFCGNYTAGRSSQLCRFSTVIVASRYGIMSYSVLSAHSMTFVPPHHSFPLSFFLSLSLFLSSSLIYLIWADCTTTAIKRLTRLRHFQILTGRRSTLYDSYQKEDLIARVFEEGGVT